MKHVDQAAGQQLSPRVRFEIARILRPFVEETGRKHMGQWFDVQITCRFMFAKSIGMFSDDCRLATLPPTKGS